MGKKKAATSRQKAKRARTEKPTATLESVVGSSTYNVWVDMLKRLVPGSRTHRLAQGRSRCCKGLPHWLRGCFSTPPIERTSDREVR